MAVPPSVLLFNDPDNFLQLITPDADHYYTDKAHQGCSIYPLNFHKGQL